jgi:uncharacterized protein
MSDSDPPPSSVRGPRPMPAFLAAGWTLGATLLFLFLLGGLVSLRPSASTDLVSQVACQAGAYLLALFGILRIHAPEASVRDFLAVRKTHAALYPLSALLGAALVVPAAALADVITNKWPTHPSDDSVLDAIHAASTPRRAAMLLAAAVAGPIVEEVFFRGALFKPLRKTLAGGAVTVVVTTAILFAMVHMEWQRAIHVGIIGLCLGYVRQVSGSLFPSILVHVAFNAIPLYIAVALSHPGSPEPDVPLPLWLVGSCLAVAVVLLSLIHLIGTRTDAALRAQEIDRA